MNFVIKKVFKSFGWGKKEIVSQQDLQELASLLFNSGMDIKASFYLKCALKKQYGNYEDEYCLIEIMPIISIR